MPARWPAGRAEPEEMVPIGVNASNLVLGPAVLRVGAFGAAEPTDSSVTPDGYMTPPNSAVWVDVGGTDGGITFETDSTYTDLQVDQEILPVGARLTELKISVTAKLAELTMQNMAVALNQAAAPSVQSGYQTMDIPAGSSATQPTYAALLIDGWAPYTSAGTAALRRIIVRKVLSQTKITLSYDKKSQQSYDCTWTCYFVSPSINPVHIVDELV